LLEGLDDKEFKRAYIRGYKAGFKKGEEQREQRERPKMQMQYQRGVGIVGMYTPARPKPGRMVHNLRKVVKLIEDLLPVTSKMDEQDLQNFEIITQFVQFNRCLSLDNYDILKDMAKKYWDVGFE